MMNEQFSKTIYGFSEGNCPEMSNLKPDCPDMSVGKDSES